MPGPRSFEGYVQRVGTHHLLLTPSGGHYMYGWKAGDTHAAGILFVYI